MVTEEFKTKFLTDRDESGRFIVYSIRTGKTYYVEPIGGERSDWGDVNVVTKKLEKSRYGDKYTGSINEKDSLITEAAGFNPKYIHKLGVGESPLGYINELDEKYPNKV